MSIIARGKKFSEKPFTNEKEFEDEVFALYRSFFGKNTIYINAKKRIESKSLGGAVPDGFLFDFSELSDPQFYIVEIELSEHSFYNHIFPQVTKFFAFLKNTKSQKTLVDKLFLIINNDDAIRNDLRKYLGQQEVYKFLSDILESSQNILLVADEQISELQEITDTYADTWGKLVKFLEIKRFGSGDDALYSISPDFETLQFIESGEEVEEEEPEDEAPKYSEEYHLEDVSPIVKEVYDKIKQIAFAQDASLFFNPQKYYISIRANRNIAFIKIRVKKIRFIAMMAEAQIREIIKSYPVKSLSEPVQQFYNGPCAAVDISNLEHVNELENLIKALVASQKSK